MTAAPTGRLVRRDDQLLIAFTRMFEAPVEEIWAWITRSDRLGRWIGTWTGDPAAGHVSFQMSAEGDDVSSSRYDIEACEPPHRLAVISISDYGTWRLGFELTESAGVTTLVMTQVVDDPASIEEMGPGWDYYLDRLVAAENGGDVTGIDFDADYFPAQREHYATIVREIGGS